jgi:predicted dehydrogenase
MKILQIGAGSMGTRRLRDLSRNPDLEIALFDERPDRRERARDRFGVPTFATLADAMAWGPNALVISTPPGTKGPFIQLALDHGLHHFSEADIWSCDAPAIERISREKHLVGAPSCSFAFLPLVQRIAPIIRAELGPLLSYQSFMATYMPAWHPGEGAEYYARHRSTAPAREMICFELHWLNRLFGPAAEIAGHFSKHGTLPGDSEDTWSISQRLRGGGVGQLTITMACAHDYRRGACFGTQGWLTWDIYSGDYAWQTDRQAGPQQAGAGPIPAVLEASYADEINTFILAILGRAIWPHPYADSQQVSATLAAAELSSVAGRWEPVDPTASPAHAPPGRD